MLLFNLELKYNIDNIYIDILCNTILSTHLNIILLYQNIICTYCFISVSN